MTVSAQFAGTNACLRYWMISVKQPRLLSHDNCAAGASTISTRCLPFTIERLKVIPKGWLTWTLRSERTEADDMLVEQQAAKPAVAVLVDNEMIGKQRRPDGQK